MQFSTIGLLIITETPGECDRIEKYSSLLAEVLIKIGYSIETFKVVGNENKTVDTAIRDALKQKDIVITWGRLKNPRTWFYEIVCDIFKQSLVRNVSLQQYLQKICFHHTKQDVCIPKHGKFLISEEQDTFPIIYLHRLFIVDEDLFFFKSFDVLVEYLESYRKVPTFTKVYDISPNLKITEFIEEITKLKNGLNVQLVEDTRNVRLKLMSKDVHELNVIQKNLFRSFDDSVVLSEFYDDYEEGLFTTDDNNIKSAINCIEECFTIYGPENVFISFNGGKDCTVLLHMMSAVLKKKHPQYKDPIYCMYVRSNNPFPQVDDFIQKMKEHYNLNIVTITSEIKEALTKILSDKPNLKACLLGTRRMDPFSEHLDHFKRTDNGWPDVMRVSPLLDWDYVNIWDYLIDFKVPYCCLYNIGYTSLGNTNNTIKNPELKYEDNVHHELYLPAYKLFDNTKERLGRDH